MEEQVDIGGELSPADEEFGETSEELEASD
jgi:hypothetical protein